MRPLNKLKGLLVYQLSHNIHISNVKQSNKDYSITNETTAVCGRGRMTTET